MASQPAYVRPARQVEHAPGNLARRAVWHDSRKAQARAPALRPQVAVHPDGLELAAQARQNMLFGLARGAGNVGGTKR
ncbi:hypothetical protein [uncultured Deinococcus sp.]|uniref:hypothetical protein n=1 Tax=uncultured Deinococcus sp. TaxID=158789 RepID=UPI0025D93A40|nr:hypothetical protein [uncultured Deinococcus sp.]